MYLTALVKTLRGTQFLAFFLSGKSLNIFFLSDYGVIVELLLAKFAPKCEFPLKKLMLVTIKNKKKCLKRSKTT